MDVCTIVAKNYLSYARVLARSFAEHRPNDRCWVLVIDEVEGYLAPESEPFELVVPADLGIESFDRMAALYGVLELSTAVKPWLLRHLLKERGLDRIVYLDPDIRLYDDLAEVDRLLNGNHMVVTPHLTDPMPRDGRKPSETDILISGCFNLGFLGLREHPDTDSLIEWWSERLETDCVVAPELGLFVDQRWLDFAPGLLRGFAVLRDPGYNVAYWNLPSRELRHRDGRYTVNGRPLRFFHFSGFEADHRYRLSRHQDRIELMPGTALHRICNEYADELVENGYDETRGWPYSWATLPNGVELDEPLRKVYREAVLEGALPRSPFSDEGARELMSWLNGPAEEGGEVGVTRYLHAVWRGRRDLQRDFPDLDGIDGPRLVSWAEVYGRAHIPDALLPRGEASGERPAFGVNVAGYFRSVLGVGELGRQVVDALRSQGVHIAPVGLVAEASRQEEEFRDEGPSNAPYSTNLMAVNADVLPAFAKQMGPGFFMNRYSIAVWAWEVAPFPERYLEAFDYVDEVWVISRYMARILEPVSPVPVLTVPLPVEVPRFEPRSRADLRLPEGFLFLFAFDYNSVFERKNPIAVIEAFASAFEPGSGPSLVVKSISHERFPEKHRMLLAAAAGHPDVHVIDAVLPRAQKDAMMASCDCYVSLHRSEGFGYTLAEAMWHGKPVIGTGFSGNLDYMTPENSYLVDYRLVRVGEGAGPYPPDGEWAAPDTAHAARLMREVAADPAAARERGRRGQRELRLSHSRAAAGRVMARRLARAEAWMGSSPRARGTRRPRIADTTRVAEMVRKGAVQGSPPSRIAWLKRRARQVVLRAIKPYSVHEQMVDNEILSALHTLDGAVQSLAASQARVERVIAESRALPQLATAGLELREHPTAGVVFGYSSPDQVSERPRRDGPARALRRELRAPERLLREARRPYVELLGGHAPVADVACGAGELLELLAERGVDCAGAEADADAAARARERGHEVELAPPLEYLERRPEGSLGAIFAAGVLTRLELDELARFLELSLRGLRAGGLLVAEAPNPHSVEAMKTFWADLENRRPLFPEVALSLCRLVGFGSGFVFHPHGSGNVEADRFDEREYALVATKEPPARAAAPAPGRGKAGATAPLGGG